MNESNHESILHCAMDEDTCLYAILGVDRNASASEIRRAYRRLALEYHPDRNEHGAETFKLVSRAYETLSDAERRNAYDVATGHGFRGGWMRGDADDDVDVTTTRGWRGNGGATRTFYRDPFDLFRDVFGDDFGTFVGGGMMPRDPFADFGRRGAPMSSSSSMFGGGGGIGGFGFDDEFDDGFGFAGSRASSMFGGTGGGFGGGGLMGMMSGGGSSMASFHTGFGGGGHAQTWSSSTSTTTTIGPDGTRRTRTVTRRTLPDGTVVESEDVSEGGIGTMPGSRHSIGGSSGGRFLRDW